MDAEKGEVIGDRYRLEHVIGEGGMGSVWRARDEKLERPVAVKLLDLARATKRRATLDSFLREAKLCAAVRHRNVVQILDFGTHREVMPFMVMEYLEGETLGDVFYFGGPLPFPRVVNIMVGALEGLTSVHDAGIVHRDLKPENIFLVHDRTGEYPKLLDFGISKSLDPRGEGVSPVSTRGDRVVGTPAYMAPEQARGLKDVDQRADIYAAGVILYEALSGVVPFYSENPGDLLVKIVTQEATPLIELVPDVGQDLSDLVAAAMHRDRDRRIPDASTMRAGLLEVAGPMLESEAARALSARPRPPSWRQTSGSYSRSSPRLSGARPAQHLAAKVSPSALPSVRAHSRGMLALVGLASGVLLAIAVLLISGRVTREEPPKFIVVEAQGAAQGAAQAPAEEVAAEPTPPRAAPAEPTSAQPAPAEAAERPAQRRPRAATERPPKPAGKERPASREALLARRFTQQKAKVARCFVEHESGSGGTAKLSLRFEVDVSGAVRSVQVLPTALAQTPLGSCVVRSASTMRFGDQPSPISFVVPVTARRSPARR